MIAGTLGVPLLRPFSSFLKPVESNKQEDEVGTDLLAKIEISGPLPQVSSGVRSVRNGSPAQG
jgi:hypothetical protein